mmetsp:Transcript_1195/g.3168  ORF Transcript_1195/g.3168 Transcript_1195/m.3168 type:complete len:202 (-) Transcript_1195:19-624(-)
MTKRVETLSPKEPSAIATNPASNDWRVTRFPWCLSNTSLSTNTSPRSPSSSMHSCSSEGERGSVSGSDAAMDLPRSSFRSKTVRRDICPAMPSSRRKSRSLPASPNMRVASAAEVTCVCTLSCSCASALSPRAAACLFTCVSTSRTAALAGFNVALSSLRLSALWAPTPRNPVPSGTTTFRPPRVQLLAPPPMPRDTPKRL